MSTALLLAEPEPAARGHLERQLTDAGFAVHGAGELAEALALAERARPDLVLLEHGDTGGQLVRLLREGEPGRSWDRDVPVIVLGGSETDAIDRARALDDGCDDFVVRPFAHEELLARIRAVLRRSSSRTSHRIEVAGLVLDPITRHVSVDGTRVALSSKEFSLLATLAAEPDRVFTKLELLRDIWGFQTQARTRTLDSHASRVRRKLAHGHGGPFVVNVWGVGYRLIDEPLH
jgi:DNA-binding response OmpR family regulator